MTVSGKPLGLTLTVGPIAVNLAHRTVDTHGGTRLSLTAAEFACLTVLIEACGVAVPRSRISEVALHKPYFFEDRSVDQLVFGLRRKLPAVAGGGSLIQSVRGVGFWMRAPDADMAA